MAESSASQDQELESQNNSSNPSHPNRTMKYYPHGKAIRQPTLTSKTYDSRLDELIRYYGQDPAIRRKLSTDINIKPEFTICLSQAETGVGKHLKSEHGYFNCWNNDRGDTLSFNSLQHSFKGLGDLCLNWKYLSAKTNLHHLYPNSPDSYCSTSNSDPICKYVYWSSKYSNRNLLNCISNIYNKQIDMNYKFRLAI